MNIKDQYRILEFGDLGDERGKLVVVEGNQDIPFDIKRVFYMYGMPVKLNMLHHQKGCLCPSEQSPFQL